MKKKLLFFIMALFLIPNVVNALEANLEFEKSYGGSGADGFNDVAPTTDGGFIAVGGMQSTDIEGLTNKGASDGIIVKYDKDGNIMWQKSYGGSSFDGFVSVAQTIDEGFIAVGRMQSTDIEGLTNKGGQDIFIVKYDKDGNIKWQKSYGGSGTDNFSEIAHTIDGGFIAVGRMQSTDIEGLTNKGGYDGIIVKYDKDGNIKWQKNYGGSNDDEFFTVSQTMDGSFIVAGYTSSIDIEGINIGGHMDGLIVKYDENGSVEWQKNYVGSDWERFYSVTPILDGGFIAVSSSGYLVKYDTTGNVEWEKDNEGIGYGAFSSVTLTTNGDFVAVGMRQLFDNGYPEQDGFVSKISFDYELESTPSENGTFDVIQSGNQGIITPNPEEGYEVKDVVIKDTKDNEVPYEEKDDKYYFDLYDDVKVEVTFDKIEVPVVDKEEIENPKTGVEDYLILLGLVLPACGGAYYLVNKKKIFKNI